MPGLISREAPERIIPRAAELQASERDIGEGLTKEELLALGQDRDQHIATAGFKQLDPDFLILERAPGGACYGDSGGPILLQSGGVEHVVASLHGVRTRFNSNVKQDCTGDFATQRVDLRTVLAFIKANIALHAP